MRRRVVMLFAIGCPLIAAGAVASDPPPATQPAGAPAEHLIVEGQLFDYVGSGVSGAEVRVFVPAGDGRAEMASTVTDDMGDFKVYHAEPIHGTLIVTFAKTGFQPHEVRVESVPGELPPFLDYPLRGALALRGAVRDHLHHRPVPGARVVLRAAYTEWSDTTDGSGRFAIEGLAPCRGTVTIDADGFARLAAGVDLEIKPDAAGAPAASSVTVRGGAETTPDGGIVFVLKPERMVHLTVTDAGGRPIPRVVVESLVKGTDDFRTAATDAAGKLTLHGLSIDAAKLELRLTHAAFVSSTAFDRTVELPPDRTESAHTLTMAPAATIVGRVTAGDGRALGGARLTVGPSVDELHATAWSDFDGAFTLSGVPAGRAVVTVHLAEHAPRLLIVDADPHERTVLQIVLSPALQATGRVIDPEGKPVANAHLRAVRWKGHDTLALQAMTDHDGRFTIADAPPDDFTVRISAPGFRALDDQTVRVGKPDLVFQFTEVRARPESPLTRLRPGDAAPAFEATTLDGRNIKLADFKGRYVFIDFWATWCAPCVAEMPHVVALHQALGPRGDFELIGVSLDFDERALRQFIKDNKLEWPQVFGDRAGATRMADRFGAGAIPASYLIGLDGRIVARDLGGRHLAETVRKLIDQPKNTGSASP